MNSKLNINIRPKCYQKVINGKVVGFCCLYKTKPGNGWQPIDEKEFEYLTSITKLSKNIGALK